MKGCYLACIRQIDALAFIKSRLEDFFLKANHSKPVGEGSLFRKSNNITYRKCCSYHKVYKSAILRRILHINK